MNEKIVKALGSVAAVAAIVMYVSYIPQIIGNLHGNRGDYIQPLRLRSTAYYGLVMAY
ncbi:hypothetical protein [Dialister invisus]|uniref:hypothetical protein n=1 Tax=Dialister invisus TaxID=218538 RepID=UPI003FEFB8AD